MGAQVHIGNCAFDSFRMYPGVVRFVSGVLGSPYTVTSLRLPKPHRTRRLTPTPVVLLTLVKGEL
jgi:hypothetical protein